MLAIDAWYDKACSIEFGGKNELVRLKHRAAPKVGNATAIIRCEAPPPGYDILWSVGVGEAIVSVTSRCGSRIAASVKVIDAIIKCARLYRWRLPTVDMPVRVGPTAKFDLNSSQKKVLGPCLLFTPIQI